MRRTPLAVPIMIAVAGTIAGVADDALAQTTVSYTCRDGSVFNASFFTGERRVFIQLDGHALTLPQRLAATGRRYAKGGVTFRVKGQSATLKRAGKTTDCTPL